MLREFALAGLLASCAAGQAQSIYKCRAGGKLTYASAPCDGAAVTAIDAPYVPEPDPRFSAELKRDKALLAGLQKARRAEALREQRAAAQAERGAAVRRQRCAKLALQKRWADQDAGRAAGFDQEATQRKAQRMGEAFAVECPD